jgi:hypothetical protein
VDWSKAAAQVVSYLKMHADWHLRNTYTRRKDDPLPLYDVVAEKLTAPDSVAQADARMELERRYRGATKDELNALRQLVNGTLDTGTVKRAKGAAHPRERLKQRRARLREQGRCWDCHNPVGLARLGRTRCSTCSIKNQAGVRVRQARQVGNLSTSQERADEHP